jgi:hypothetical protein
MNGVAENYSLSEPYTELKSNYNAHLTIGRNSLPKNVSIGRDSIEKGYSLLTKKYHQPKYSLQICNNIKFGWKERFPIFKEVSMIGATESSMLKEFDKWKSEEKHKKLSITPAESIQISRIFVTEEASLEVLFMLADEGTQSIEELCNTIPPKEETVRVLFDLWEYDIISMKGDKVSITPRGNELVTKLLKKSQ